MTDDKDRSDSQKSRQELLDEIYLLRDVAGEREQQAVRLQAELDRILRSRLWRATASLRALRRGLKRVAAAHTSAKQARLLPPARVRAASRPDTPCLFVDVTELALREGRTGVQRVTREILHALLVSPPEGYAVEPVYAVAGQTYRLARRFAARESGSDDKAIAEPPMQARSGDVFLGLDHAMRAVTEHAGQLKALHENGVRLWFVCNDTLPLSRPDWFPPEIHVTFKAWFETISRVGDGLACISQATEADVRHWLDALAIARELPLALGHFQLGCDIGSRTSVRDRSVGNQVLVRHSREGGNPVSLCPNGLNSPDARFRGEGNNDSSFPGITQDQQAVINRMHGTQSFLMVGTLEPRKGHAQALEAFNQLWARGDDVMLVLVGLPGWMTDVTQRRIRHHDEYGQRLFWFADASDALLERLYANCTALLAPSEGEGFGLPLIEAARHRLPILCRDLPVFREVAGECASYYSGDDAASLADAMDQWLENHRHGATISSAGMPCLSWTDSAQKLMGVVLGGRTAPFEVNDQEGNRHT